MADRVMYGASALGDSSLISALLGSTKSLRSARDEQAFLRIHHASDIVAGAALGTVLGLLARRLWRLPPRR